MWWMRRVLCVGEKPSDVKNVWGFSI